MKTLQLLLSVMLSLSGYAQSKTIQQSLDTVLGSAKKEFYNLEGSLRGIRFSDTLYSSLLTIEGTSSNYIKRGRGGFHGFYASLGKGLTLVKAKALVKHWNSLLTKAINKHPFKEEEIGNYEMDEGGYHFVITGPAYTLNIVMDYSIQNRNKYDSKLSFVVSRNTESL